LDERVVLVREDDVLLGGEVAEDGAGRDLGALGDLLDRGAVVPLFLDQVVGGLPDRHARLDLLPFAQAQLTGWSANRGSCHGHALIVRHPPSPGPWPGRAGEPSAAGVGSGTEAFPLRPAAPPAPPA